MNAYTDRVPIHSLAVAPKPRVIVAGSVITFSGRVLSLLQSEFPEFRFERVGEATLEDAAWASTPHLLIYDEAGFSEAFHRATSTGTPVAVAFDDPGAIAALRAEHGINALPRTFSLLPMKTPPDRWLAIVRLLLLQETFVPAEVLQGLLKSQGARSVGAQKSAESEAGPQALPLGSAWNADSTAASSFAALSNQERKVLKCLARGKQNKVIAAELGIAVNTAKLHVSRVLFKLGVRNRTEAAAVYLAHRD